MKIPKKRKKNSDVPQLTVTSGKIIHQNMCIGYTHSLLEFDENMCYQTQILLIFGDFFFSGIRGPLFK